MIKITQEIVRRTLLFVANTAHIDLLFLAYEQIGIPVHNENYSLWEQRFITSDLPRLSPGKILFDVGANVGDYSNFLKSTFPDADIYLFEPNPHSFEKIPKSYRHAFNIGFSSKKGRSKIYFYKDDAATTSASVIEGVISGRERPYASADIMLDTIDDFCVANEIDHIDFLKVDVEGYELEVLKGAQKMLPYIKVLQLEFNLHNILSRTFLKDFYTLMPDFTFYRIGPHRLIPLGPYKPHNEIFRIQNLVAVRKSTGV